MSFELRLARCLYSAHGEVSKLNQSTDDDDDWFASRDVLGRKAELLDLSLRGEILSWQVGKEQSQGIGTQ